jgi:predicted N-formylglutamate amidohydrolase
MPEILPSLVFTCEHASPRIPSRFAKVAARAGSALQTHRGHDPGTEALGRRFAAAYRAPIFLGRYSRLLVELNRSVGHPNLWSEFSDTLSTDQKSRLLASYYHPYRRAIEDHCRNVITRGGRILHLSVHSFTPAWDGKPRRADLGLLYDPGRRRERTFCAAWKERLEADPVGRTCRVRRNYPYRGVADGLVTSLRRLFPDRVYAGIELEVSQAFPLGPAKAWRDLQAALVRTFQP